MPAQDINRHPQCVPHGCFRCAGEDSWIVVAAADANMWHGLALLIGGPDWAENASLKSPAACRCIENAIETEIAAWALTRDANEAMSELQAPRSQPALRGCQLACSKIGHLESRAFLQEVERGFVGLHPQPSMPIREGARPYLIRTAAPTLGHHNREILSGLLGLSDCEIAQLVTEGITGTKMLCEEEPAKARSVSSDCKVDPTAPSTAEPLAVGPPGQGLIAGQGAVEPLPERTTQHRSTARVDLVCLSSHVLRTTRISRSANLRFPGK
ncbi:CoA transferase [Bradyrhizobium sp. STM 3561]|uniref:CoA transferase n=1 Tax=Bradyrhizobium sp. STM 3561 TaxID=578923 RepID=UPI00388F291D